MAFQDDLHQAIDRYEDGLASGKVKAWDPKRPTPIPQSIDRALRAFLRLHLSVWDLEPTD